MRMQVRTFTWQTKAQVMMSLPQPYDVCDTSNEALSIAKSILS